MSSICILVYTHSEYFFMWKAMIPLLLKHVNGVKIHWLYEETADIDLINANIPLDWHKHTYSENLIWTKRVYKALGEIDEEYILFLHEDWLPIGSVDISILNDMTKFMKEQNCGHLLSYSHVSRTSIQDGIFTGYKDYYFYKEEYHLFQPAIWNKITYLDFCNKLDKSKHQNEDVECLNFMNLKNCYWVQNKETVTTIRTTNSLFYPHMHALSEGLWNFLKYPTLKEMLEEFCIDTDMRGVHTWWELGTQ